MQNPMTDSTMTPDEALAVLDDVRCEILIPNGGTYADTLDAALATLAAHIEAQRVRVEELEREVREAYAAVESKAGWEWRVRAESAESRVAELEAVVCAPSAAMPASAAERAMLASAAALWAECKRQSDPARAWRNRFVSELTERRREAGDGYEYARTHAEASANEFEDAFLAARWAANKVEKETGGRQ